MKHAAGTTKNRPWPHITGAALAVWYHSDIKPFTSQELLVIIVLGSVSGIQECEHFSGEHQVSAGQRGVQPSWAAEPLFETVFENSEKHCPFLSPQPCETSH